MAEVTVVLTFDDGPHALADLSRNYTAQALRTLRTNGVQANTKGVFFVQTHVPHRGGSRVGREAIQRIWAEGHVVGIHTGSVEDHVPHTQRRGELRGDLEGARRYLQELGITSTFVRPVGGQTNSAVLATYRDLGLKMVLWDIDSRDSHGGYNRGRITAHLRQRVGALAGAGKSEVVVLFHELDSDTRGNIEHYMETIAKTFQEAGHEARFPTTRNDVLAVLQRYARS
jgi:peptidoglycan/xylan/chitin deacetylase (PgdA/CDA1 family)